MLIEEREMAKRKFIPNQIFIGLPWQLGAKYDRVIAKLHAKYPLYFTIVGRRDAQDAVNLFDVIKERIETSPISRDEARAI